MEYMSTLEGLESVWNALCRCYEHRVGARAILYRFVKVTESCYLIIIVNKVPCSLSVYYEACHIDGLHEYSGGP